MRATSSPAGGHSDLRIRFCEDIETIYDQLEVSTSASASLGKVASVEAKAKFVRSLRVTSTTLTVVVNARVTASNESAVNAHLDPGIALPTDKAGAKAFFDKYGDSYVSRLAKGAEYVAAYVFYSQTTEEREQVKASLKASGIVDGVTLAAKVGTAMEHAVENSKMRYTLNQTVLGRGPIGLPKPEEMIDFALRFNKETPRSNPDAVVLAHEVLGYESLGVPFFAEVEENRRRLEGGHGDPGVARRRARLFEVRNQARWLKDVVYPIYGFDTGDAFNQCYRQIESDLMSQANWLDKVADDPTALNPIPSDGSLRLGVPVFAYMWVDAPSLGGLGGKAFRDVVMTDAKPGESLSITQVPWLSAVSARGGDMCDSINLSYAYNEGAVGAETRSAVFKHGGPGGSTDSEVLQLNARQHIKNITAQVGTDEYKYVHQLHLETTGGQTWTFPAKIGGGGWGPTAPCSWDVPQGEVVVGFAGRSGRFLDQLEPLVIRIAQPNWVPHQN